MSPTSYQTAPPRGGPTRVAGPPHGRASDRSHAQRDGRDLEPPPRSPKVVLTSLGRQVGVGKWTARLAAILVAAVMVLGATADAAAAHTATAAKPSGALAAVGAAVDATLAAGSARVRLQISDGSAFGKPGKSLSGTGQYSFVDGLGTLKFQPVLIFAVAQLYLNQPAGRSAGGTQLPWSFIDYDSEELTEAHYQGTLLQA